MVTLAEAYASCERDVRARYENFPVASLLLPRAMRRHVAAVYAFARAADDFADEGDRTAQERQDLLDGWAHRLRHAASSAEPGPPARRGEPPTAVPTFVAVGATMRACRLPVSPFEDLLSAFRQDVTVRRYATWADVLDYCRRSANPVGRLVLRIAGHIDRQFDAWSDAICTALQLTNFWQDLKIDFDRGRLYLPVEEQQRHGAREEDLKTGRITSEWHAALAVAALKTRDLFGQGKPLCDAVSGRLRYELRAVWLGGTRILDHVERAGFDVVRRRPRLGAVDAAWILGNAVMWRTGSLKASGYLGTGGRKPSDFRES